MVIGHLALAVAALFTGAAFYINFAEQPARLELKDRPLLVEWKKAYQRGFAMQASLALIGFALGAIAWRQTGKPAFMVGALLMLAPWPWTFLRSKPSNDARMATDPAKARPKIRALLHQWNRLHAVRTVLGALAVISFLFALSTG